ncbi:hypothetical protein BD413DRAFT_540085 [Trametes elegans]|nr:hypothetical protein BD413DRAFT_540085 [Trametes elegans]
MWANVSDIASPSTLPPASMMNLHDSNQSTPAIHDLSDLCHAATFLTVLRRPQSAECQARNTPRLYNSTRCRCSVRRCKTLLVDSEGRHHHLQRGFRPGALIRTELTSTIKAATRRLTNTPRDCRAKLIHPLTIACSLFFQQCTGLHRLRGSNVRSAQPGVPVGPL